ncbi:MAG: ABC transporter substrate-binding protein [Gemmobacter sp.]|jgi:NitT/TauT family transport system substrate-binding protein|nr:ABC transporter substrate-binding protein [Gemmobacter sp.]
MNFLTPLALALTMPLASMAIAEDLPELTVALAVDDANFNPTTGSVFRLAEEFGFYAKHGVKVTFVTLDGTPQAVAALQSGAADVADISLDAMVRLKAENGVDLRGVVATATGSPFLIVAKDDIKTLADLKGRAYAIADNGSLDHMLTLAVLRDKALADAAPDWVAIGAPVVRVQALAAGQVDATTVSYGTYSTIDGTPGIHILMSAADFSASAPAVSKLTAARPETLVNKAEAVQRFTTALIDAARELEANPARWVDAGVAARPDLTRESLERTAKSIATRWCVNGCMDPAKLDGSVAFVYANPEMKDMPVLSTAELVDLSFTEKALAELGTEGGASMDARN